jgi:peptidoglycan/xylan/chitin deacetylase (PgdA/CDA1 family)
MFIHQIPRIVPKLLPKLIWSNPGWGTNNAVYFTFDDGPTPEITNFVLDCLAQYEAKATFFCIGKNVVSNPEIAYQIQSNGHRIGNHTMNHANAWKYKREDYQQNYMACEEVFEQLNIKSVGFRPPYGRVNSFIYQNMTLTTPIYMWTFLSGDYNQDLSVSSIIQAGIKHIKPGSILVFHDSVKAFPRLKIVLPALLDYCIQQNYKPEVL